jgi:hypothetical protein
MAALRIAVLLVLVSAPAVALAASAKPPKPALHVTADTGGVVKTINGRINCPQRCSATYKQRALRELQAVPNKYFDFAGWTGGCFGYVARCVLDVDRPTSVHAHFMRLTGTLVWSVTGPGALELRGTTLRGTGSASFPEGEPLTLTPTPDSGASLKGWAEGCAGAPLDGCTVTVGDVQNVVAAFGQTTPGAGDRTLSVDVDGGATVTSTPPGIDCPGTCSASFPAGTLIALRSSAPQGTFTDWQGGDACNVRSYVSTCLFVLDTSTSVSVHGYVNQYAYLHPQTIVVTVAGPGSVMEERGNIACGRHFRYCATSMDPRDDWTLRLSPVPGPHARFGGWRGDCIGKRPHCNLSNGSFEVLAFFRRR